MTTFLAKIGESGLSFGSGANRARWLDFARKNRDKWVRIEPQEKVSPEARGYFEGAVIPAFCDWHDQLDSDNPADRQAARDWFKAEFNGRVVRGLDGQPVKIPKGSTNDLGRRGFREEFVEKIVRYFEENQIPVPDPELYKKWRDEFAFDNPLETYREWLVRNGLKADGTPK